MSVFILGLCNADPTLLESVLCSPGPSRGSGSVQVGLVRWVGGWYLVSTGGPGEVGGTGYSVEMMSSRAYSATEKTPERCFGNSGENWSADSPLA